MIKAQTICAGLKWMMAKMMAEIKMARLWVVPFCLNRLMIPILKHTSSAIGPMIATVNIPMGL